MIDLIKGEILDDLLHVEKLHDKHAVRLEALSNSVGHRMQFLKMKKHPGGIDQIKLAIQRCARLAPLKDVVRAVSDTAVAIAIAAVSFGRFHAKNVEYPNALKCFSCVPSFDPISSTPDFCGRPA